MINKNDFHHISEDDLRSMLDCINEDYEDDDIEEEYNQKVNELIDSGLLYQNDDGDWFLSIHV